MAGRTGSSLVQWAVLLASLIVTAVDVCAGTRAGNFYYKGEVKLLDGRIIDVSDTMVALAPLFRADVRRDTTVITSEPPSIFILVDNSATMQTNPGNDRSGSRFTTAGTFIDSVYAKYPNAEMGLAVFGTHLYFDPNDRPYFAACSTQAMGAYVPLLRLDSAYSAYSGQTGYQILKSLLAISTYDTGANQYVTLSYQPTDTTLRGGGCNLTAGFDAAKSAMASASASQCGRYVLLFSDGNANAPGGDTTWYFRDSVKDVPTTFSVFFPDSATLQNSPGLRNIDTMTRNIRVNGYDTSNAPDSGCTTRSNYFAGNSANLMSTLIPVVWQIIRTENRTSPSLITVNGTLSTTRSGDSCFVLNNMIPLTGQITPVSVSIIYSIFQNYVKVKDTVVSITYNVRTLPNLSAAWNPGKDSFDIWTWDRDLVFRYNSTPIQFVADTMDSVELYFTFDSGTARYGYDNVYIDLYNALPPIDSQNIQLSRVSDRVFAGKFKRQIATTANRGEPQPVLQYRGNNDSVIAVFRNRENLTSMKTRLPLDTLRKSIGFVGLTMTMTVTDTTVLAGDITFPMRPSVTDSAGGAVPDTWVIPRLTWTQLPPVYTGDRIIAASGQYSSFTATMVDTLTPRRILITLTLPDGSFLMDTFFIRVFPDPTNSVMDNTDKLLLLESWKVFSDNGRVRVHLPVQGAHSVKIYSLTGQLVASRETGQGDALFQLPRGVYCIRVEDPLSGRAVKGRVVNK